MTTSTDIRLSEIIAPPFHDVHKAIKAHQYTHFDLSGGRGSTKSSFVSIEVVLLIKQNPDCHALILRKVANTLRDSVYAQYCWAIDMLCIGNEFEFRVSPMEIIYKPTGQKIMFRGADDKAKIKSIKVPFGYIGITHFEEKDQFSGREEIRSILQSTMRGGERFWNFETYNPPQTQSNWANKDSLIARAGRLTHKSVYTDVPVSWLGQQFFDEAEELKRTNLKAYLHEYEGEVTGTGGSVFENVRVEAITDAEISQFDRIYRGLDFGWYPDPNAFVECHYNPAQRKLYIFNEIRRNKTSNEQMARILEPYKSNEIIADSAEPKSIGDFRAWGFAMRSAEKGSGSIDYSIKWLQSLVDIVIDPQRCPNTAEEFLNYEYERTKDGEIISGYPDRDNHFIDAVRYALNRIWKRKGQ